MVESLYGELDPERRAEFDAHLSECADCATLLNEFQRTAAVVSRRRRPDPGPEYWEGYWRRLEQRDPSLLTRADYLAPYPVLWAFLQKHPEIARNPSFFLGNFEYYEPRPQDRSHFESLFRLN